MMNMNAMLLVGMLSALVTKVSGDGQAGTIVYSRDSSCKGQELVRSYSGQCIQYLNPNTNQLEYAKYSCSTNNGFVTVESFIDSSCQSRTGNITELLSNSVGDGSCQKIYGYQNNYLSAQLLCDNTDSALKSKLGTNFVKDKITFRYYSNFDTACSMHPSIIEMWSEDRCLYYESIGFLTHESYKGTGMYGIYTQEVSEVGMGDAGMTPSIVSVRYFNTNDCRQALDGPVEGEPPPGGIGSPVRRSLRSLQEGGVEGEVGGDPEGQIGGHDGQQKSEIYNVDYKINHCSNSAPAIIQGSLFESSLEEIYGTYVTVSADAMLYLDFVEMSGVDRGEDMDETEMSGMSAPVVLVSWALLGAVTGLVAYFAYGFYAQFVGSDVTLGGENKSIIENAQREQEMSGARCNQIQY
mmetsp:Transcript_17098/g.28560  ORF Transcript_17098/g.28560 Transcript_17098/m.28560 type:complete len:409 (+) Transcript_17098:51-1277(+)